MNIEVIFSSKAEEEVLDSFHWYEHRVIGLGKQFIDAIDLIIELIVQNPEGFPIKRKPYREAALKKFPYQIIYKYLEKEQIIYILHTFNSKRDPRLKYR